MMRGKENFCGLSDNSEALLLTVPAKGWTSLLENLDQENSLCACLPLCKRNGGQSLFLVEFR